MSSPAASAPLAVLVLAWDETTPAARVLVEATELQAPPDSVVALVPTGPPAHELSQEEFLPLEASAAPPEPVVTPSPPQAEKPAIADSTELAPDTTEASETAPLLPATPSPASTLPELLTATANPTEATDSAAPTDGLTAAVAQAAPATTTAALVGPALVYQEVRVLHFDTYSPAVLASTSAQVAPTLVWSGASDVPAAPYLGSSEPLLAAQGRLATEGSAVAAALLAATDTAASALVALRTLGPPPVEMAATLPDGAEARTAPPAYLLAESPAAPDAEPDALPTPISDEPAPLTDASTTELSEEAAEESFAVDATPVQAAEPTIPAPLVPASPAPAVAEPALLAPADASDFAALYPAAQSFNAPNLNFQIIQYARLAVPQALAEQPFEVIYAPAWPTWLAAQELRHRSGQPLVLHLAQLAAADEELVDLAAGWVAEIQRQALHRADLILTETPALAQRLRRELTLPAHRVRPVPAADAAAVAQALRTAQRY